MTDLRWERKIRENPPPPRTPEQAEALRLLAESTERLRAEQVRQAALINRALAHGARRAAVAVAAGLTYDQLRMREQRGQALPART